MVLAALGLSGCTLLARDHPCWPFLDDRFDGHVPYDVVKQLARERHAKKHIGGSVAPIGSYWRPARPINDPDHANGVVYHTEHPGWEIVPCPAGARAAQVHLLRDAAHAASDGDVEPAVPPQGAALPLGRRSRTVDE